MNRHPLALADSTPTRRPTAFDRMRSWLLHVRIPAWMHEPGNWLALAFLTLAVFTVGAVLWLLWALINAIGSGLAALAHAGGEGLNAATHWLADWPITEVINQPVRAYLDTHSAGLPATGHDLWILWLLACTVLYIAALTGSRYARISWIVIGALTATAAWHGTTTAAGRPVAAATTTAMWLLLSLPAFARRRTTPAVCSDRLAPTGAMRPVPESA